MTIALPKRLIEVDLPIKRISAHARREKAIRHGHISTLHIWWARRPLAACRAVICAALWPDPADVNCPASFISVARREMQAWTSHERQRLLSVESRIRFEAARKSTERFEDAEELQHALLDFIADFADWDNARIEEYLQTSRALTQSAHESLGGQPGTRPLFVDPFAGGGSIPLEVLRVGGDAFASDLNPVAVVLNTVVLDYIPKYGQRLGDEIRKWAGWISRDAEKELEQFYPKNADGARPIAYLWARTIQCEGPGCGAEVPLIRSLWLAKKANRSVAVTLVPRPDAKRVDFRILVQEPTGWVHQDDKTRVEIPKLEGTIKGGSATCPCCGFTTPKARLRQQLVLKRGGANDARLFCVITTRDDAHGRTYRLPTETDLRAIATAKERLTSIESATIRGLSLLPNEGIPQERVWKNNPVRVHLYGMTQWRDLFTDRQALALTTYVKALAECTKQNEPRNDTEFQAAVHSCLALAIDRCADKGASVVVWDNTRDMATHVFGRQALPMVWDFAESNPLSEVGWMGAVEWIFRVVDGNATLGLRPGHVELASATSHPLPNDSADAFITDPPYYDAVPYSTLSNFFYVWLKRTVPDSMSTLFMETLSPNSEECVLDEAREKTHAFYEAKMTSALAEGRRILMSGGIGLVVFAHKSTSGWEALLQAIIDAGWIVTGSWPIDTEMGTRLRAQNSAALASSVHLALRPRGYQEVVDTIGDWRDVLSELPHRIHSWMPRLAAEGVVGADAIFACIGPALEIFSRFSRVEKASGDAVTLKEYLEQVWAAVAKEALTMIFSGADATGFEEDARLTAMWLWTLNAGNTNGDDDSAEEETEDEAEGGAKKTKTAGFVLEYDAARKIAQGLGAHLENLTSLVQVSGEQARLLPVAERARHLFGKNESKVTQPQRKKRDPQMDLFKVLQEVEETTPSFGETKVGRVGETVLDRIHQSMILFAAGRGEAMKRLLIEDGVGRDQRFWRLAQALAALYPTGTDERRWVEGVLARKKGLGL